MLLGFSNTDWTQHSSKLGLFQYGAVVVSVVVYWYTGGDVDKAGSILLFSNVIAGYLGIKSPV